MKRETCKTLLWIGIIWIGLIVLLGIFILLVSSPPSPYREHSWAPFFLWFIVVSIPGIISIIIALVKWNSEKEIKIK